MEVSVGECIPTTRWNGGMTSKIYKLGTGKEAGKLRDLKVNFRR